MLCLEALWPGGAVIVYGNPSLSLNMKVLFRITPFCHLQVLEALRPGGAVTVFGSLSGPGLDIQVSQLFGKSVNSFIIYQWCAPRIPYLHPFFTSIHTEPLPSSVAAVRQVHQELHHLPVVCA